MAYQHSVQTGRPRPLFVHLREAYHGDTLGAVSVGGVELFHATYRPLLLNTAVIGSPGVRAPGQKPEERAVEVVAELAAVLRERGDEVCAIVVEPMIQAAGGMLTYDAHFLREARRLATAHGALLICDEVATGIGRTGTMWAAEHAGIVPDLLTAGKGLTGGYLPLSAVLATDEVYNAFLGSPSSGRTFFHGHTYTANPLACAVGLESLALLRETTLPNARAQLPAFAAALDRISRLPGVRAIRHCGLMAGIDLEPREGRHLGVEVCTSIRRHGVILRPLGDLVVWMPPLTLQPADLELLERATITALRETLA
jgi:adenosylmethionine-8-amino-7-oxononanoate aminotransferase